MGRHESATERWRTGIALRLYALALVPILFAVAGAGLEIRRVQQQAHEAALVGGNIPELAARQSLLVAMLQESGATEIDMRAASIGLDTRQMLKIIGAIQSLPATQTKVDRDLASIRTSDPKLADRYRSEVDAARAFAKRPGTSAEMSSERYMVIQKGVLDDLVASNGDLISRVGGLSSYSGVSQGLQTASTLGTALYYREIQTDTLGQLILGSALPRTALIANLSRASGVYSQASEQLLHSKDPQVATMWAALVNAPVTHTLDQLFDSLMTHETVDTAILLKSSLAETKASAVLVNTAISVAAHEQAQLTTLSKSVKAEADKALRTTCLGTLLILAITFAFALRVTRSIRRPLSDLERGARAVNTGAAQVTAIVPRGPRETRTVISSFNDLLANLRLVEAKSQALAEQDLSHPALDERLPGRIGAALDASMQALSESVAERTKLAKQLAYDADHDALTGLANRQMALNWLGASLLAHRQEHGRLAVLFIDLDGFKRVNDTHGHRVGDHLLVQVADQITRVVGGDGMVARLGGDEFLVLAEGQDIPSALALGKQIVQALSHTFELGSISASIGASVGVALAGDDDGHPTELVAHADMALYRAKQDGRGRVQLFDDSMQRDSAETADREAALRATLGRGGDELQLHYQTIVDTDGRTRAVEALVRWARPGSGLLTAKEFIPFAAARDLVIDVDCWVLTAALQQAAVWQNDPRTSDLILSVNVSGCHLLSGQLPRHVEQALAASGLSPRHLILEITESVLPANVEVVKRELAALRATGVRIALDDFGVGATSVSTLRALPLDILKLGHSLTQNAQDPAGRDLLGVLSNLGHVLGFTVIADGVETAEQCEAVRANGADLVQGRVFAAPVPAHQLAAALESGATPTVSAPLKQRRPRSVTTAGPDQDRSHQASHDMV